MAFAATHLPISMILIIMIVIIISNINANPIQLGSSLSPAKTATWLSPSGIFAFGFYPRKNTTTNATGFGIGVQMLTQTQPTILWTAMGQNRLYSRDAVLVLTETTLVVRDGRLVTSLLDVRSQEDFPALRRPARQRVTSAAMLDSGNLVVSRYNSSDDVWQSFDYPTDAILVDQKLTKKLTSGETGYELVLERDGNLLLYARKSKYYPENAYWASSLPSPLYQQLRLDSTGVLYLESSGPGPPGPLILANGTGNGEDETVYRATLDADGVFRLYSHDILTGAGGKRRPASGVVKWSAPGERCQVTGVCGLNSFCGAVSGANFSSCLCYPGFVFLNAGDSSLGCYKNFTEPSCGGGMDYDQDAYTLSVIHNITFPDHSYSVKPAKDMEVCVKSCLEDCNCFAALYTTSDCSKYKLPLMCGHTVNNPNVMSVGLFKSTNRTMHTPPVPEVIVIEQKKTQIVILASVFGSFIFLLFALAASSFVVYRRRARSYERVFENANAGFSHGDNFTLQPFSYDELEKATDNFSEELGKGSFGAVYKGSINGVAIAVKRLEKVVEEGVREFRAEMTAIGRTHHRNLVQLLGFCIEGSRRLLVYEYMSNGSLASLLFDSSADRPDWRKRVKIALDIARGLYYLHEECGVHIIHCNLKPRNVLLDETWTAKISDFGFARLLAPGQAELSMRYFAPEWQKNALISVKSDIYSFGAVLFEIVCCRRSIEVEVSSPDEIMLSAWVYECFVRGELGKLIEGDDSAVEERTLERMVKVGLWCVQDDPALRPAMRNVMLMLEGTMDIPLPPPPKLPLVPF